MTLRFVIRERRYYLDDLEECFRTDIVYLQGIPAVYYIFTGNDFRVNFALVAIAFSVCLHIRRWANEHLKPIEVKNHGYKANSFFRHGLECWRSTLRTMSHELDLFIQVIEQALN